MSNVNLSIGGRDYAVACAEGEEAHIADLGQLISAKLETLPGGTAQSETRSLLFAALLLADEVHELRNGAGSGKANDLTFDTPLDRIAARLENLASRLEINGHGA